MSSSSTPVATVTVPPTVPPQPTPLSGLVLFYRHDDGNLRFGAPGQTAGSATNTLTPGAPGVWVPEYSGWYYWNESDSKIFFGTSNPFQNGIAINSPTTAHTDSASQQRPTSTSLSSTPPDSSTAISTSTVAPASQTISSSNNGLSIPAIAGIAVGSFIGGALIAALLTWFMTKKKKPSNKTDSEASTVLLATREKPSDTKTISISSSSPILYASEGVAAQPLEDKAISGEISKISNLIKNHVQSYYHSKNVSAGMIDYDDLHALGPGLPVSVGTLGTLLGNSATREIALRFCIAWVVTSRIQLHESSHRTFLPLEISECLQSMSPESWDTKVHTTLLAKWRVLTAELMQSAYVRNAFSLDDSRIHNIQGATGVLENVLRPYIDTRMDNGQRSRNLEEILKRAAQFAFTLFSQQSEWDFDWQEDQQAANAGSICVFPALVQNTDDNGEAMKPPRPFSEAVVRRLDE
ncbi:hypothetical protein DM02DRAFT_634595 [Periconia macrospinosa]|uniref:Uncharacterized protein n=1 Tax=Periconia macrospinosa TaxID=97972 RepID=A0A2V1D5V6_9PLEO|nr:hypothetical protein DM02DRAFT_634595 [Periconia macrospinosa]